MKAIIFSLTIQQPLLATSFQGDPNSDVSYAYITGSMIRGAVIGRYMKQHQISDLDIADPQIRDLFFDDHKIRYLNAYIESKDKKVRTLPVPRSLTKDKSADLPMPIYDKATSEDLPEEPKSVEQSFCTVSGESVALYSVERRINIHNQRDRSKGRSTKDKINLDTSKVERKGEGEIFRYDAIDAGQTFQAAILCDTDKYDVIEKLLNSKDDIWLGGSQSAGYGHCKISNIKSDNNWSEVSIPAAKRTSQDNLVITLLSSAILRDEYGQPVANPNLVKDEIERVLGIADLSKPLPEAKPIYAGSENIGGFNRKWGLPLPQVPALAMGSVFVFEDFQLAEEQIKLLESQGIGERRVDGFGRIAVNWLSETKFNAKKADQQTKFDKGQLQGDSLALAEKMADRLLKQKLEQKLLEQIGRLSIQNGISNSQLSRLRLVARQALPDNSQLVLDILDNLPRNAQKQLETKIKVGNRETPLKLQIETWLQNPQEWMTNVDVVKIANVEKGLTGSLAMEYTLRLIESIAKKATKELKEEKGNE